MAKANNADDILNVVKDVIYCPITLQIMCEPVVASDGRIYEKTVIEELLQRKESNNKSPITGKFLTKTLIPAYTSISLRDEMVQKYPHLKDDIYKPTKSHLKYKYEIRQIIINKHFTELLQYSNFSLKLFNDKEICDLLDYCKNKIIKHIIDNCDNLNEKISTKNIHYDYASSSSSSSTDDYDYTGSNFIHHVCKILDYTILKYLLKKGVDINVTNNLKKTPLHIACQYNNGKCIKYLLEKGADLKMIDNNNYKPFDYLVLNEKIISDKNKTDKMFVNTFIDTLDIGFNFIQK